MNRYSCQMRILGSFYPEIGFFAVQKRDWKQIQILNFVPGQGFSNFPCAMC
ncbi:hypothetical protein TRIP_B200255 [uncultured Desulfatiglans sp.]|nr:hypothetical protein TRIP_B200255 [uncultured Desulfatiglans sp.]